MTTFGMDEWLNAGRTLLDAPIPAEQYMNLILERQRVYEAANPPVKWARTLPEWFVWPGDDDFVILPDRTTAPKPEPTRTDADRLADAQAGVARWTERLAAAEAAWTAAYDRARPKTTDNAVVNIPLARRQRGLDSQLRRVSEATKVRDNARAKLAMAEARVRKYAARITGGKA